MLIGSNQMFSITHHTVKFSCAFKTNAQAAPTTHPEGKPATLSRHPTTRFLNATLLIAYQIRKPCVVIMAVKSASPVLEACLNKSETQEELQ